MVKLAFCTHEQARYAVMAWHYSRSMPAGKLVKIGVWEDNKYIGAVIFGRGANNNIAKPYGLTQYQVCELVRVALNTHQTPVTKIVKIALTMLKKSNPGLKLVISYADCDKGHDGKIYQAGNWIYEGKMMEDSTDSSFILNGKRIHGRTISSKYKPHYVDPKLRTQWLKDNIDPNAHAYVTKGKHKYLMALDEETRKVIQLRGKPYPKPVEATSVSSVSVAQTPSRS